MQSGSNQASNWPAFIKFSQVTIGILAFFYIIYIGRDILIPLVFALIISILLNPVVNFLDRKGLNKVIAIILCITLLILIFGGVLYFIGSQVTMFSDALPQLEQKFNTLFSDAINWCSQTFKINKLKINSWITDKKGETLNNAGSMIGGALTTISGFFIIVFLIPVYIFMFLFYKPLLLDFVSQVFRKDKHTAVAEVLASTKALIQSYLVGLLIEMGIIATMNSTLLLIIGVDYAILLGIIGAILNLIPYIGGLIAIALPMLMAFVTGTPMQALFVLCGYVVVQLIDNNYIIPKIVASKVKVNALVSIIVVLIGGALWGIAGMFLSIPLTALCKVVFDKVQPLKPLGFLIGDSMPPIGRDIFRIYSVKPEVIAADPEPGPEQRPKRRRKRHYKKNNPSSGPSAA
ncbi:MAG TPA: AI-2E family transporter [Bacteroidia bacterium]|jgi:predicted PurR-regulated permease PerM